MKLIVSCIDNAPETGTGSQRSKVPVPFSGRELRNRCCKPSPPAAGAVRVEPLTNDERFEIVCQVPSLSAKRLAAKQIQLLLSNPATDNPLFLLVALEELRGFGSYEQLDARIAAFPREGDTVTAIFDQVIERLREEFDPDVVRTVLASWRAAATGCRSASCLN